MGRWIPRILLEWREPEPVRRWRDAEGRRALSPWTRPLLVLLFVATILPAWFIEREFPGGASLPFVIHLSMAVGWGLLICYGLPQVYRLFRSRVWISEQAISRGTGGEIRHVLLEKVSSYWIETRRIGPASWQVLVVRSSEGRTSILGLGGDVTDARVRETLAGLGVPLEHPEAARQA